MEDSKKHQGLRRQLIQDLRSKGIISESVLMVMLKTPRHFFMDQGLINFAYHDQAYPIAADQTISQPYTVAYQSELLQLSKFDKVQDYIDSGDCDQVNLAQRFSSDYSGDHMIAYQQLRDVCPTPFSAFMELNAQQA